VYTANGTSLTAPHTVEGTLLLSTVHPSFDDANVTLSGSAAFSDASSYACTVTVDSGSVALLGPGLGLEVSNASGSSFMITGPHEASAYSVYYICTGN
jgi:hypothetical protein